MLKKEEECLHVRMNVETECEEESWQLDTNKTAGQAAGGGGSVLAPPHSGLKASPGVSAEMGQASYEKPSPHGNPSHETKHRVLCMVTTCMPRPPRKKSKKKHQTPPLGQGSWRTRLYQKKTGEMEEITPSECQKEESPFSDPPDQFPGLNGKFGGRYGLGK